MKKERKKGVIFLENFKNFISHIEGLEKAIESSMFISIKLYKNENDKIEKFIESKGKNIKIFKKYKTFKLEIRDQDKYEKLLKQVEISELAIKLLPRSIFISLVSQFDLLMAGLMKAVLIKYPEIITKEKSLAFEEILKLSSFEDIKYYFINEEISGVLNGNHAGQIDWFEKKNIIKIKFLIEDQWDAYIELTERRNIFVHNDGIINEYYLHNCKKNKIRIIDDGHKKGEMLGVTPEYFKKSYQCLYEISAKLSWLVWRKIESGDIDMIDNFFNDIGLDLIRKGEYLLAENLFDFMLNNSNDSVDFTKNIFLINYALSKKLSGKIDEARNILNEKDWTSCRLELQLSQNVILGNLKKAFEIMIKIGKKSDVLNSNNYETDPIYKDLRDAVEFKKVFKKIFGEEYVSNEN